MTPLFDAEKKLELYDAYLLSIKQSCLDNDCYCVGHTNTNTNTLQGFNDELDSINTMLGKAIKIS